MTHLMDLIAPSTNSPQTLNCLVEDRMVNFDGDTPHLLGVRHPGPLPVGDGEVVCRPRLGRETGTFQCHR